MLIFNGFDIALIVLNP